jgi:hypothetical protein
LFKFDFAENMRFPDRTLYLDLKRKIRDKIIYESEKLSWPKTLAGRGCLPCYTYALAAASGAPSSDRAYNIDTTR